MSHLRLVHSAPSSSAIVHPCIEAFQRELDYVHETLRRLGAKEHEIEDLAHEVFLTLHLGWRAYDPAYPLRPHLFAIAFRVVCALRGSSERELPPPPLDTADDELEPMPTSRWMSVLLEAGKIVPRQPDTIRDRAFARARTALSKGHGVRPEPAPRERERGPGLRVVLPLVLAFAVGATGVAVALRGQRDGMPTVSSIPAVTAAETELAAETGPAPTISPTPARPAQRPRSNHLVSAVPTAEKPSRSGELEYLQRALAAFISQDFDAALTALGEHARHFPRGWLTEEREALRVRSLAGAGRLAEARAAAADFGARFPHSVLGQSVAGPHQARD
jgi:hypothetical protein